MGRDKYGNYVNDEGVTIKISEDKQGKDHISFYDGPVDEDHSAVHINIDYEKEKWTSKTHDEGHSNTEPGSGGCYLTSACMAEYSENFDDNCYELKLLRWFRDNFVSKNDIEHYYRIAPDIVSKINQQPNRFAIYKKIYENVVKVCISAIENKRFNLAYNIYRESVLILEKEFLLA